MTYSAHCATRDRAATIRDLRRGQTLQETQRRRALCAVGGPDELQVDYVFFFPAHTLDAVAFEVGVNTLADDVNLDVSPGLVPRFLPSKTPV